MRETSFFPLLFGFLALGTGIGLCINGIITLIISRRYRNFPVAKGVIKNIELKERKGYNRITDRLVSSYVPILEYTYKIEGKAYTGRRFTFRNVSVNEKLAGKIREIFAPGNPVKVFYNPNDPEDAVLNTSGGEVGWAFLFGSIFIVFGVTYVLGLLSQ